MKFAHDIHPAAYRRADLAKRFHADLDILWRDITTVRRESELIERPDLHRGDAHVEQRLRQFGGPSREGDLVLVGARGGFVAAIRGHQFPVGTCLIVGVAGTGVVDADFLARQAAQQFVHWAV